MKKGKPESLPFKNQKGPTDGWPSKLLFLRSFLLGGCLLWGGLLSGFLSCHVFDSPDHYYVTSRAKRKHKNVKMFWRVRSIAEWLDGKTVLE
jgi:hypothetical protein